MNQHRILSEKEKERLRAVLSRDESTTLLVHGEGKNREISFYAEGTRLEARLSYPDEE